MEMAAVMSDLITASASTVFIVAKAASVTTNEADIFNNQTLFGDNGLWNGFFVLKDDDTASAFGHNGTNDPTATVAYVPGNWVVFTAWHDGADLAVTANYGTPSTAALVARNQVNNTPVLGITNDFSDMDYVTKFFDGDLGEILTYNRALSNQERLFVVNYLINKWNIT